MEIGKNVDKKSASEETNKCSKGMLVIRDGAPLQCENAVMSIEN